MYKAWRLREIFDAGSVYLLIFLIFSLKYNKFAVTLVFLQFCGSFKTRLSNSDFHNREEFWNYTFCLALDLNKYFLFVELYTLL